MNEREEDKICGNCAHFEHIGCGIGRCSKDEARKYALQKATFCDMFVSLEQSRIAELEQQLKEARADVEFLRLFVAEKDKEINRLLDDKQALHIAATINHERRQG